MRSLFVILGAVFMMSQAFAAERVLKNDIVIRSSVEEAWQAMTTSDGMKAWAVKDALIEMKHMGRYWTHYSGKVGDPNTITNTVLSYLPNRMFSFKLGYPEEFKVPDEKGVLTAVPEVVAADTIFSVMEFEDLGNGEIRAISTMPGFQDGHQWDLTYNFFNWGNDYTLKKLKAHLERRR